MPQLMNKKSQTLLCLKWTYWLSRIDCRVDSLSWRYLRRFFIKKNMANFEVWWLSAFSKLDFDRKKSIFTESILHVKTFMVMRIVRSFDPIILFRIRELVNNFYCSQSIHYILYSLCVCVCVYTILIIIIFLFRQVWFGYMINWLINLNTWITKSLAYMKAEAGCCNF